jgi:hypothetical protein
MFVFFANDDLFSDWGSFEPVSRILTDCGLTPEEVSLYETPFNEFRHQEPDVPLRLPENVRTSDEWFRLLFTSIEGEILPCSKDPDIVSIDASHQSVEGISGRGIPVKGYLGQINLDNIGRDFLCLIYYQQRILDLCVADKYDLRPVFSQLFKADEREPQEYTNLNNSLILIEAVFDYLTIVGCKSDGCKRKDKMMTILSDPPQRHLTLKEIPSFVGMVRDSSHLSRYIRNLSSCLQDGGKWADFIKIDRNDYDLTESFTILRDRRDSYNTEKFSQYVSMSREFSLWDIYRGRKLPSIRTISEAKGIPYIDLLRILMFGYTNNDTSLERYEGLRLLRSGLSDRLAQIFQRDISNHFPSNTIDF